jgi:hypothetical protein
MSRAVRFLHQGRGHERILRRGRQLSVSQQLFEITNGEVFPSFRRASLVSAVPSKCGSGGDFLTGGRRAQ